MRDMWNFYKEDERGELTMFNDSEYSTGYFARATENGHKACSTKTHIVRGKLPLCGYRPHKTMQFMFNSAGIYMPFVECKKCKETAVVRTMNKILDEAKGKIGRSVDERKVNKLKIKFVCNRCKGKGKCKQVTKYYFPNHEKQSTTCHMCNGKGWTEKTFSRVLEVTEVE